MDAFDLVLAAAAAVCLLLLCAHTWLERMPGRVRHVETGARVPGPVGLWLAWDSLQQLQKARSDQFVCSVVEENAPKYGRIWAGYLFGEPTVWIGDAEAAKAVLRDDEAYEKGRLSSSFFDRVVKRSLNDVLGEDWTRQRHLLSPAFHFETLQAMMPTFVEKAQQLADIISGRVATGATEGVAVLPLITRVTLDVIGAVAFGKDFGALQEEERGESHPVKIAYEKVISELANPLRFFSVYNRYKTEINKDVSVWNTYIEEIIAEKRSIAAPASLEKSRSSVLDLLLRASSNGVLPDDELLDNSKLFYIAGHETSSAALTWTLGCLANNPEAQEKLYLEVSRTLGDKKALTAESVKEMRYLHNCIKEALRVNGPATLLFRKATRDQVLAGYHIPKGMTISISQLMLHMDPEYWDQPTRYMPERFEQKLSHPFAYLPFGAGPRVCLGQQLAMLEMRTILALLVQRFVFKPVPGHELKRSQSIILRPAQSYRVQFVPRAQH